MDNNHFCSQLGTAINLSKQVACLLVFYLIILHANALKGRVRGKILDSKTGALLLNDTHYQPNDWSATDTKDCGGELK